MFDTFVAMGDSQTEGLSDPDGNGGYVGWADRFAHHLAEANPDVRYANLAVRGKVTAEVHAEQLPAALAMKPALAAVMSGVNDARRPSHAIEDAVGLLEDMYARLAGIGATVVTCTFPDIAGRIPFGGRLEPRLAELNAGIRDAAQRCDAIVVDFETHEPSNHESLWSHDRIHLNSKGHALLAAAVADSIGLPGAAGWRDPIAPSPTAPRSVRLASDLRWAATTVLPSLIRHARGRSSGDGVVAKRPALERVVQLSRQQPATD